LSGGRLSLDESTGHSECLVEDVAQDGVVVVGGSVAEQAAASVDREVRGPDDQERQAVGWDLRTPAVVVDAALLAAMDPADRVSRSGLSKCATGRSCWRSYTSTTRLRSGQKASTGRALDRPDRPGSPRSQSERCSLSPRAPRSVSIRSRM